MFGLLVLICMARARVRGGKCDIVFFLVGWFRIVNGTPGVLRVQGDITYGDLDDITFTSLTLPLS